MERIILPLNLEDNHSLFLNEEKLKVLKEEIEMFLDGEKYMNSLIFSKKVLFSHEIQANNTIEGYNDDIAIIENVIKKMDNISDSEKRQRILNLYSGYKYILQGKNINPENLKKLYTILSKGLLSQEDLSNMGTYYRLNPVYIFFSSLCDIEPDQGMSVENVEKSMNSLFEYINNNNPGTATDLFIKSQIIHFYFVYIHPYYDINGRTSRSLSMWYLLNNKCYPFIIFNRGITLSKRRYYDIIRDVKKFHNITFFINYMLQNVKVELEKEYVMEALSQTATSKLKALDYQTLHLILSTNGLKTLTDFTHFYNRTNEKKKNNQIFEEMFVPLIDKGLLTIVRDTQSMAFSNTPNFIYKLNYDKASIDNSKIKRLNLK